jgi:hypothetical protein
MLEVFVPKYHWSEVSKARLLTCDIRLQLIFNKVLCHHDCSVLCGFRNESAQNKAYREGKSNVPWPKSMHNRDPSLAADVVPYPVQWKGWEKDHGPLHFFAGIVISTGWDMGIEIKWGGHFKSIFDGPHFELIET